MQQVTIDKTRENSKQGYTSAFGPLSVHTLTVGGVDYEYHSKSNILKQKPGDSVWCTFTTDKQGNNKIKIEKAPNNAPIQAQQQVMPIGNTHVPYVGAPSTSLSPPHDLKLRIFEALCTLKSGTPATLEQSIPALLVHTDQLVERFG